MSKPIKMYWWNKNTNFGDLLNPLFAQRLFNKTIIHETDPFKADLIGIGSVWHGNIIDEQEKLSKDGLHVWGTGFYGSKNHVKNRLIPHLVRGKVIAERFPGFSGAMGDAGLLSSELLNKQPAKSYATGIICHWKERGNEAVSSLVKQLPNSVLIDVLQPPEDVIKQIAACDTVLSSSLHGLIVADSIKVPNQWVVFTDEVNDQRIKFEDYYSVFDIKAEPLNAAAGHTLPKVDFSRYKRPGLETIKSDITAAFPAL